MKRLGLLAAMCLAGLLSAPPPAAAFSTNVHTYILHAAFDRAGTMTSQTVDALVGLNADVDWHQFTPEYHFDSAGDPSAICDRVTAGLSTDMSAAIAALHPEGDAYQYVRDRPVALATFAAVTHEIEDFYSHSNWIELAYAADSTIDLPPQAPLLNELFGCAPDDFPPALQTGYFNLAYGTDGCPSSGSPPADFGGWYCHEALAKDHPDSGHGADVVPGHGFTYHQVAVLLATQATRAAWDVLHDLFVAEYGDVRGLDVECAFNKLGFAEVAGSERACRTPVPAAPAMSVPSTPAPTAIPTATAIPTTAPAPFYVYLLGADGGIGVVIATEQEAKTRPSCQWAGGGLDCSRPAPIFQALGGPYASLAQAHADLKSTLTCGNGYWGPFMTLGTKFYWLQNNVTLNDCRSIK
jgi:hypothetical protein